MKIDQGRRSFIAAAAVSIVTGEMALMGTAQASFPLIRQIKAGVLDIGYYEAGPADGPPVKH